MDHKKGSIEDAVAFFFDEAPDLQYVINALLRDVYNFQCTGAAPIVHHTVKLKDGRTLRLYGSLS